MGTNGWAGEYWRFLTRMARRHPAEFCKRFLTWNLSVFAPALAPHSKPGPVLRCSDVDAAVRAFQRDGYVVLSDALTQDEAQELFDIVKAKADEIVRLDEEGKIPPESRHGDRRYSWGEYGHNREWEHLARNEKVLPILRGIWKGHDFSAVAAGGDFMLPGAGWQTLHSDMKWDGTGEPEPRLLIVNYYVSDVNVENGPVRIVPRTGRFPVPNYRLVGKREPRWMKESLVTGKRGYAVVRDPRAWHGGTPNTSTAPRYMPNIEFVMAGASREEVCSTASLEEIDRGRCIEEFTAVAHAAG